MTIDFNKKKEEKRAKAITDINLINQECEYQENMKVRKALKALGKSELMDDGIDHTLEDKFHERLSEEYEAACDRMFEAVMDEFDELDKKEGKI